MSREEIKFSIIEAHWPYGNGDWSLFDSPDIQWAIGGDGDDADAVIEALIAYVRDLRDGQESSE